VGLFHAKIPAQNTQILNQNKKPVSWSEIIKENIHFEWI
jgi:hypothetical protein